MSAPPPLESAPGSGINVTEIISLVVVLLVIISFVALVSVYRVTHWLLKSDHEYVVQMSKDFLSMLTRLEAHQDSQRYPENASPELTTLTMLTMWYVSSTPRTAQCSPMVELYFEHIHCPTRT